MTREEFLKSKLIDHMATPEALKVMISNTISESATIRAHYFDDKQSTSELAAIDLYVLTDKWFHLIRISESEKTATASSVPIAAVKRISRSLESKQSLFEVTREKDGKFTLGIDFHQEHGLPSIILTPPTESFLKTHYWDFVRELTTFLG